MTTRNATKTKPAAKIPHDKFIVDAILRLRKGEHKGIHVVFSGFNQAFKDYYGEEARPFVDDAVRRGVVVVRPSRGGAIMTLASDADQSRPDPKEVLAKILKG